MGEGWASGHDQSRPTTDDLHLKQQNDSVISLKNNAASFPCDAFSAYACIPYAQGVSFERVIMHVTDR